MTAPTYARRVAYQRVSIDHRVMGGAPCILGTRIPVAMVVRMVAARTSVEQILSEFPQLTAADVEEALRFAAARVDPRARPPDQPA